MLIKNLIDFGFSEKEAKIYVALLELEIATASEIAKKTEINRSSTYVVLDSLKKQGFVNMSGDKTIKQYIAAQPEMLLYFAQKRAEKQEKMKLVIENIMPDLKALHGDTKHKPKIMVYEGIESVGTLYYNESSKIKCEDTWRSYEDIAEIKKYLPGYMEKDCTERMKKKIVLHGINPNTRENLDIVKEYINIPHSDTNLLIPANKFKSPKQPIDFDIYGDEVSFSSFKEPFAVVIKHQEIADTLKNIFDLAWKEAERLGKKYKSKAL